MSERYPGEEAERAVLGMMMISEAALGTGLEILSAHHFHDASHRVIFNAMVQVDQQGRAVDMISVSDQAGPDLEQFGGFKAIAELTSHVVVSNMRQTATLVYNRAVGRRIERIGAAITEVAQEHLPVEERDARIDRLLSTMYDTTADGDEPPLSEALMAAVRDAERTAAGESFGIASGFNDLDKIVGGFQPGQLIVFASRPGMGKTALGVNIAQNVASRNVPALIFALEMPSKELAGRLISRQSEVPFSRIRVTPEDLDTDEWAKINMAVATLTAQPLYIDDRPPYTMASIRARARRAVRSKGVKIIVIDYLQLIAAEFRGENRQVEVAETSRSLKMLARELEVPVLVMAQLSRATEKREEKRPQLSDLRDSGAIEQDSDIVIFPWREGYYDPTDGDRAELIVAKHRNGEVGTVYARWHASTVEFADVMGTRTVRAPVESSDVPWHADPAL